MSAAIRHGASSDAVRAVRLSQILSYHAATQPRRPAFTDADGQADFKTLHNRANRLANALTAAGIRKGDRVTLRLPNSRRHFEALFGCANLAAILVPLPADASASDIDAIKHDCAPALSIESEQAECQRSCPILAQTAPASDAC